MDASTDSEERLDTRHTEHCTVYYEMVGHAEADDSRADQQTISTNLPARLYRFHDVAHMTSSGKSWGSDGHVVDDETGQGSLAHVRGGSGASARISKHHVAHLHASRHLQSDARPLPSLLPVAYCQQHLGHRAHTCACPLSLSPATAGHTTVGCSCPGREPVPRPPHCRFTSLSSVTTSMSGSVAVARPSQPPRLRRESQRPGVARTMTRQSNMEDEGVKQEDARKYGTSPGPRQKKGHSC